MKAFSHINIGEKISFIIGCKNYLILVVSKKTDKPCANCMNLLKQGGQFPATNRPNPHEVLESKL